MIIKNVRRNKIITDNSISLDNTIPDEYATISAAIYREFLGTHNVVLQRQVLLAEGSFGIEG